MPEKPNIDCTTLFPKIASIIRKYGRDRYLNYSDIAQRLQHDDLVKGLATPTRSESDIGSKAVALFGAQYTRKSTKFGMGRYRKEFSRQQEGGCWAYRISENWARKRESCYLCANDFELTNEVFRTELFYGKISIKRDIQWKDMVLTVFAKNSKDEDVLLCKGCLSSALSRCSQEARKTSMPMTAGMQFRGF